jgi:dihydroorotate dehydrogenase
LRSPNASAEGGLSGVPLQAAANAVIRHIRKQSGNKLAIIGVGGIDTAAAALEALRAGANLLQLYTGLVYQGPSLLQAIHSGLAQLLAQRGARSLAELVAA